MLNASVSSPLVEEVLDALAGRPIALLLKQDCHESNSSIEALGERASESRRLVVLRPPHGDLPLATVYAELARQAGFAKPVSNVGEWQIAFDERLGQQDYFVLVRDFDRAGRATRESLGSVLRSLTEYHGPSLWVVMVGGEHLAELIYEHGQDSLLYGAADELEWPELTSEDVLRKAARMSVVLNEPKAELLVSETGRDARLVHEVLHRWKRSPDEPIGRILQRSPKLAAIFTPFRDRPDDRDWLCGWLRNGDLGFYSPWPADALLRKLYWRGALRVEDDQFHWRSKAVVAVGLEVLGCDG